MMPGRGYADSERDALAILAAAGTEDVEGIGAVLGNSNVPMVIGMLAGMLLEVLRDHDADPAGWVADRQARNRSRDEPDGPGTPRARMN